MYVQLGLPLLSELPERQSSKIIHANSIGISAKVRAQEGMSSDTGLMLDMMKSSQVKKMVTNRPETNNKASEYDRAYHGSTCSRRKNIRNCSQSKSLFFAQDVCVTSMSLTKSACSCVLVAIKSRVLECIYS